MSDLETLQREQAQTPLRWRLVSAAIGAVVFGILYGLLIHYAPALHWRWWVFSLVATAGALTGFICSSRWARDLFNLIATQT